MNHDTCVIIPVYNEAEVIEDVLRSVKKEFANILCVDDGSDDESADLILKSGVKLVQHAKNKGSGAALRTGIQQALSDPKNKYFITFDADGQHRASDAASMLKYLRRNDVDIVLGSRFLGSAIDMPAIKRVVLKAAIWFSNVTTGLKMTDTHNGLRVFDRDVAAKMRLYCSGMAHASEIIYRIAENQFRYAERPVTIIYTAYSKAKGQSVFNAFNILRELMVYRFRVMRES
ncbi:MAG: glycosyltransferase family 2 protein [Patescibacteria group bacterium]